MKRRLLIFVSALVAVALLAWVLRPKHLPVGEGYVSERSVTLWSSMAQVREPAGSLHFGEKVEILVRRGTQARVRTLAGAVGWVDARLLLEPSLWQRSMQLISKARAMPVQARGRTKVASNLRVEPGRTAPRLYQFSRGMPVEVLARAAADWSSAPEEKEASGSEPEIKKEDWFLVRGFATRPPGEGATQARDAAAAPAEITDRPVPIAGWVVARFIELDLPEPVRDYASSSGMRVVAWFELNRVSDPSGEKPQYLVAGQHGPEGQPCDFTMIRVYTWGAKRRSYETAFVESDICGKLPIRVAKSRAGDPEFRFDEAGSGTAPERVYRMRQTIVRRVREDGGAGKPAPKLPPKS